MTIYSLNTAFNFGQYESKTLEDVLQLNPSYVDWCLQNVDFFCLDNEIFEQQKHLFSVQAQEGQTRKYEEFLEEDDDYDDYRDQDRNTFNALTDGQYGDYDDFDGDFDSLMDGMGY
jgi:hypothetical protein